MNRPAGGWAFLNSRVRESAAWMGKKRSPGVRARAGARAEKCASGPHRPTPSSAQASCDPIYILRLQGRGTHADIRYLRLLLKMLGRAYGFRALSVEEERP
jgi:hypothetical protein